MREIVLDTETTGMEPAEGHKLVEIGCVELSNQVPTGRTFHVYLNPERPVPAEAVAVHGLTDEFLKDKPVFSQVYTDFLDFIAEGQLVIHNAAFDMKFINAELQKVGHRAVPPRRVLDTLMLARQKFPGSPASLDALCRRFNIDLSGRTLHGALLDAQLLAEVYLEMTGGRQQGLELTQQAVRIDDAPVADAAGPRSKKFRAPRAHEADASEIAAHEAMLESLKDPLWRKRV